VYIPSPLLGSSEIISYQSGQGKFKLDTGSYEDMGAWKLAKEKGLIKRLTHNLVS
jgi:hypothetical protein